MKKLFALLLVLTLSLCSVAALGDTVELNGSVVNVSPMPLTFSAAGTVGSVPFSAGDRVSANDTVATLKATPVYATASGLAHVFAEAGDSIEALTERYGAVVSVEPTVRYTLSCSVKTAYNLEENRIVHPGETVYVRSISTPTITGQGTVTQVSGDSFTLELEGNDFVSGNSFYLYRDPAYAATTKLGKGSISRATYTAYTGEGIVSRLYVKEGDLVQKGDLLFETLTATYAGNKDDLSLVKASADGILTEMQVTAGTPVESGAILGTLYPDSGLRIRVLADEESLATLTVGKAVSMSLTYADENAAIYTCTVEKISSIGEADPAGISEESFYPVILKPETNEGLRYGMTVTVVAE